VGTDDDLGTARQSEGSSESRLEAPTPASVPL